MGSDADSSDEEDVVKEEEEAQGEGICPPIGRSRG